MEQTTVIVLGYPASGKTTATARYEILGYSRLNRDTLGGQLDSLVPRLEALLKEGKSVVLDNLYPTIASRKAVIDVSKKHKVPVVCDWVTTSIEDAQYNACTRMVKKYGKLLGPDEIKKAKDPNCFPPAPLFVYKKEFQKPSKAEGFADIREIPFVRTYGQAYTNKAIFLDKDGTLTECISGGKYPCTVSDIRALAGRGDVLKRRKKQGYRLLGASNQSGVAKGVLSEATLQDILAATNKLLGVDIEWAYCPHKIPPITCFCRKPMPGLLVAFIEKYKLDPRQCIFVGDATSDKTCASRAGVQFVHESEFFQSES